MKKSFSIIETLISVLLLSVTIATLLQTKQNNLFILTSIDEKSSFDGYVSIHNVSKLSNDENINFKDYISLNDDELRAKLKDKKITFKKELIDKIQLKENEIDLNFEISQETYSGDKLGKKTFYRVELK